MKKRAKSTTATASDVEFDAVISAAWEGVGTSFDGETIAEKKLRDGWASCQPAGDAFGGCGAVSWGHYERSSDRPGYRWGGTAGKVGSHCGAVAEERPRVLATVIGQKLSLPSWEEARDAGPRVKSAKSLLFRG